MPWDPSVRSDERHLWRSRELMRAITDVAEALGWHVFSVTALRRRVGGPDGDDPGPSGPILLLVHSGQQRFVLARLTVRSRKDTATTASDLLTIASRGSVATQSASALLESIVWDPAEVVNGSVASLLAWAQQPTDEAA